MTGIIKAEYMKIKRTMSLKLIVIFPIIVFAMAYIFTMGMTNAYAESVWNWWYTLLLPGMLAIFCNLSITREKKIKYYNQMTLSTGRRKLMLGKIFFIGCIIFASNCIVLCGAICGGRVLTTSVPVIGAIVTVPILTLVSLWEIPLFLFLSERFGMIVELIVCLFITIGGIIIAPTSKWIYVVSSIPMRVVCPLLHVLPNGVRCAAGDPLLDKSVILQGIAVSLIWFVIGTVLFLNWFEKREVK